MESDEMDRYESPGFEKLKKSRSDLIKILPPETARNLGKEKLLAYGAFDSSEMIGFSVYSVQPTSLAAVRMVYLEVNEEYRGFGVGKRLADFSSEELKQTGVHLILYRNASIDPGDILKCFDIGLYLGLQPISESESLYLYSRTDISKSFLFWNMLKSSNDIEATILQDYQSPLLGSFNQKDEFGSLELNADTFDPEYSLFLTDSSGIRGGIIGKVFTRDLLVLREIAPDKLSVITKVKLPGLLLRCLDTGLSNKDIDSFCITLSGTIDRQAIEKLFGEPQAVYRSVDMVKYI